MKGDSFSLSLVAVDQVNHSLTDDTVMVHSYLSCAESGLGKGQLIQMISCTKLTFSINSL